MREALNLHVLPPCLRAAWGPEGRTVSCRVLPSHALCPSPAGRPPHPERSSSGGAAAPPVLYLPAAHGVLQASHPAPTSGTRGPHPLVSEVSASLQPWSLRAAPCGPARCVLSPTPPPPPPCERHCLGGCCAVFRAGVLPHQQGDQGMIRTCWNHP